MESIKNKLTEIIKELFAVELAVEMTPAPENTGADYASNVAMKLAKEVGKNPREIATLISEKFGDGIEIAGPGFLNFKLSDEYYLSKIEDFLVDFEKNISNMIYSGKTVVCEFSDPNPFKVLHVGHLYTSIVGDAISRLFEFSGAKVVRANFGGDVGLHVAKTLWGMKQEKIEDFSIEDVAKCYVVGNRAYEENEDAKAEIVQINKRIYAINKNDEHGEELADFYWKGRELSYEYFKDFYAEIGLKFDRFYPESAVADLGLVKVKEQLDKGVYEMSDGAVVFRGEEFGLHTRVFVNKEGVPTYETKDVGLIFQKDADWHFDKSVVITGNEQADYMKVVLKSVEQYAPELVEKTTHLTHGLVKLPGNVKMSSRLGNGLLAVDVLDMVAKELKDEYDSEDSRVFLGATKYAFLKYKMGGDIIFDPKESVKMTGNSGPYLLYSAVRCKKIIAKCKKTEENADFSCNEFEKNLMRKIMQYKEILGGAVSEMAPHKICNYLYELAQEFSRFYENCPVVGSEFEVGRKKLVQVYLKVIEHGLGLLGIQVPEEM